MPSRSTPALVAFGRECSVTGNEPNVGRFNNVLSDASLAGNPSEVRAVMPNPPMAEAHNPARLGLTAAMRQGMLASSSISIQVQIGQNHCLAIITFYVNITNLCTVLLNFILSPSCLALTREKFVPPQRVNKKDTPLPVSAVTASSLVGTWTLPAADDLQPDGSRVHATWSESQHKGGAMDFAGFQSGYADFFGTAAQACACKSAGCRVGTFPIPGRN